MHREKVVNVLNGILAVILCGVLVAAAGCSGWPSMEEEEAPEGPTTISTAFDGEQAAVVRVLEFNSAGWAAGDVDWIMASWHPRAAVVTEKGGEPVSREEYRRFVTNAISDMEGVEYSDFKAFDIAPDTAAVTCARRMVRHGVTDRATLRYTLVRHEGIWLLEKNEYK
ncbi:MAG: DUF4440 domain-containing protein [Desulfatibacillaceae bacterium]